MAAGMLGDRGSKLLVLGWSATVGAFAFLAWSDFALIANAEWCGSADQHCLREWVGALSGWAAAVAAGLTILFLHRESIKRDILDWREIVNSAELLRGSLLPQIEHLGAAIRAVEEARTAWWLGSCLDKIEAALLDPANQDFKRASVIIAARLRTCLLLLTHCKYLVEAAKTRRRPVGEKGMLTATHQELQALAAELEEIRDSAFDPKAYRGV